MEMRLMRSPREGLEMDLVRGESGRRQTAPYGGGPAFGTAHVDVAVDDVGDPVEEGAHVVGPTDPLAEPGARVPTVSGQPEHLEAAFLGEYVDLPCEQWLPGEPFDEDRLARRVGHPLG